MSFNEVLLAVVFGSVLDQTTSVLVCTPICGAKVIRAVVNMAATMWHILLDRPRGRVMLSCHRLLMTNSKRMIIYTLFHYSFIEEEEGEKVDEEEEG